MADRIWPEDAGTTGDSNYDGDDADAASLAAHRHTSIATDYVESGLSISADYTNDEITVGSGMCFISDSSADLAQSSGSWDHGVTYGVSVDSKTEPMSDASGDNDVFIAIDPTNGPDDVSVEITSDGSTPGDPSIHIARVDASNEEVREFNRAPDILPQTVGRVVYAEAFESIQAAVNYARDYENESDEYQSRVQIPPGEYSEDIQLHRRVTLVGNATTNNDFTAGDTVLTGNITTEEYDGGDSSWAVGLEDIVLAGATVNIDTGTSTSINRITNVNLREDASLTVDGRISILEGIRTYYDSADDDGPPEITLEAEGTCLWGVAGDADITVNADNCAVRDVGWSPSEDTTVTVDAQQCIIENIDGDVTIDDSKNLVQQVSGTVTLNKAFNYASSVAYGSDATVEINENANTVVNANGDVNATGSNNLILGTTGQHDVTVDGDSNVVMRVVADVTIDGGDDNVVISVGGSLTDNGTGTDTLGA